MNAETFNSLSEAAKLAATVATKGAIPAPAGPARTMDDLLAENALLRRKVASLKAQEDRDDAEFEAAIADRDQARGRVSELEAELLRLNTLRGDVAQLIERERADGRDCVDIDDLEDALMLGPDEEAAS